ncbi:MAG: hypothetical protein LBE74_01305 [Treponema sp.]|jgi:hypothetical protein|nr:hypothetical protein [Treponema sp.]
MVIFTEQEEELLNQIWAFLDTNYSHRGEQVKKEFDHLERFGNAVAEYPEIYPEQRISREHSLKEKLLMGGFTTNKLYIPVRAVAIHSFLLLKYDSLFQLSQIFQPITAFRTHLKSNMFLIICILMAEKVYCACLESAWFPRKAKELMVDALIRLWNNAPQSAGDPCFSHLEQLWQARYSSPPVFGTMDGNSEILKLSIEMPPDWDVFMKTAPEETIQSLQEFVFGLSYEDIQRERERLLRVGKTSIGTDEFYKFFGAVDLAYKFIDTEDPRTFYNFFIERRNKTARRQDLSEEGPKRTIEELFLEYFSERFGNSFPPLEIRRELH